MITWKNRESNIQMMPVNKSYVPRIIKPRNPKMPTHSVQMFVEDDILPENIVWKDCANGPSFKAFIAKYTARHKITGKDGFVYVVRAITLRLPPMQPPNLLGN